MIVFKTLTRCSSISSDEEVQTTTETNDVIDEEIRSSETAVARKCQSSYTETHDTTNCCVAGF